jgi:hypothetical protein
MLRIPDFGELLETHGVEVADQLFEHLSEELTRSAGRVMPVFEWRPEVLVFLAEQPFEEEHLTHFVHGLTHGQQHMAAATHVSTIRIHYNVNGGVLPLERAGSPERAFETLDALAARLAA